MRYGLLASRWLMEPVALQRMISDLMTVTPDAIMAAQTAVMAYVERQPVLRMQGSAVIIDASGPITYRPSWFSMLFGGATIFDMQRQFRMALADPTVERIVFRWNSPGGTVDMVPEFADEVFAARGIKPILSVADTDVLSAAYWIASQSDTIYGSKSSRFGAIGIWTAHEDISGMLEKMGVKITLISHGEHKVDANSFEPLRDEAKSVIQAQVDDVGDAFDEAAARGRGVTKKVVLDTFGQGLVFNGNKAAKIGLSDKSGTIDVVLAKLAPKRPRGLAANIHVPPVAESDMPIKPSDEEAARAAQLRADQDAINVALALTE